MAGTWMNCGESYLQLRIQSFPDVYSGNRAYTLLPVSAPMKGACMSVAFVSTLGNEKGDNDKNVLDIELVSSDQKL